MRRACHGLFGPWGTRFRGDGKPDLIVGDEQARRLDPGSETMTESPARPETRDRDTGRPVSGEAPLVQIGLHGAIAVFLGPHVSS